MKRLILVRHAPTAATKAARFPGNEKIVVPREESLARLRGSVPDRAEIRTSPAQSCVETAAAAGLESTIEPALTDIDLGSWAGLTLPEVHRRDAIGAATWLGDPDARPHGGETLNELSRRVVDWLESVAESDGWTVAITHTGVIRAAVVAALEAPLESWWRIDVSPLSLTELHARDGHWTLKHVNVSG